MELITETIKGGGGRGHLDLKDTSSTIIKPTFGLISFFDDENPTGEELYTLPT